MSKTIPGSLSLRLYAVALLAALVQIGILWATDLPLGVPQEWTWARTEFSSWDWLTIWPALVTAGVLCCFVFTTSRRIAQVSKFARGLLLLLLWILGTIWILSETASVPGIAGLSRAPFVLYYPRSSGYFTQARTEVDELGDFLATYRTRIQDSDDPENYLHLGTHPPGLTTAFVLLIDLCEWSPSFRNLILATQPESIRSGFAIIREHHPEVGQESLDVDAAVLWLATLITALSAAGTCVPLYLLSRRCASIETSWWTAAVWLLVPATAVFLPKSDIVFPCLVCWLQWMWLKGVDHDSLWWGVAAGSGMFIAVCLTLAFAPIGLMFVLQSFLVQSPPSGTAQPVTSATVKQSRFGTWRPKLIFGSAFAFGVLILISWLLCSINLILVWMQNLRNHAAFYSHATRTYLPWLIENPIELGFSLGLPLSCLGLCGLWILLRHRRPLRLDLLIPIIVWGLLLISGKNMGEAARLWIFLMPYAVWLASPAIEAGLQSSRSRMWLMAGFMLQLVVCLATVLRIDGFHFAELIL